MSTFPPKTFDVIQFVDDILEEQKKQRDLRDSQAPELEDAILPDMSFTCIALHLIDPTALLLPKRDIARCARHLQSRLVLDVAGKDDNLCKDITKCDCRNEHGENKQVHDQVLAHMADRVARTLVIREGRSLRIFSEDQPLGAFITRHGEDNAVLYQLTAMTESREATTGMLANFRKDWAKEICDKVSKMLKAELVQVAMTLGILSSTGGNPRKKAAMTNNYVRTLKKPELMAKVTDEIRAILGE